MNRLTKTMLICVVLLFAFNSFSQSEQKFAHLGNFTTTEGKLIKDCKIGYRTVGELNADKSNVVLWPTWFTGTSEHVFSFGAINTMIDTEGLYIVVVDALTNGVSSSPSNSSEFPTVSIRDMVNSQHSLLVNHLNIKHVKAVMGVSLGGMQTYEWAVAYPDFMDQVIPIIGSPKQSSYDILVWQTMADLIIEAGQDKEQLDFAYKRAHNILLMNMNTPAFVATTQNPDSLQTYLDGHYSQLMKPEDYLGGIKAMIPHDIYKSSNSTLVNIGDVIKAEMLVIIGVQDHLVNPISSVALAEKMNVKLVSLEGNCGHMSPFCEAEKVKNAISTFLK